MLSDNNDGSDGDQQGPTIEEVEVDVDYKAVIDALADEKLQESLNRAKAPTTDEDSDGIEVIEVSEEQKAAFVKLHTDMQRLSRRLKKAGWVKVKDETVEGKTKKGAKVEGKTKMGVKEVGTSSAKEKGKETGVEKDTKKKKKLDSKLYMWGRFVGHETYRLCLKV